MLVNSLITSPTPAARLRRGEPAQLRGKAWDGGAGIAGVQVSIGAPITDGEAKQILDYLDANYSGKSG